MAKKKMAQKKPPQFESRVATAIMAETPTPVKRTRKEEMAYADGQRDAYMKAQEMVAPRPYVSEEVREDTTVVRRYFSPGEVEHAIRETYSILSNAKVELNASGVYVETRTQVVHHG